MPLWVFKDSAWKQGVLFVRKAGVWKQGDISAHVDSAWADASVALSAEVSPSSVYAEGNFVPTTETVTVTPSGGSSPYTYAWTFDSTDGGIVATSPTADATTFHGSGIDPGDTRNAIARCTVTDDDGNTAYALVAVTLVRTYAT
jgi:hypothetical protein